MKKKGGLGSGLDQLLGSEPAPTPTSSAQQTMAVTRLRAGKYQPRTRMNSESLAELAESIKTQGIMQPILVRPVQGDGYEIIAGERRFRAAQLAGLSEVPVLIKEVPDESALAMALIENIQRENLNPLEEAQGVQRLIREFDFTHEQAAHAIGRSRSATSNLLRLLNLAAPVQDMLMEGLLDMGHARALLAVDGATQIQLGHQIQAKGLSVREAEGLVARAHQDSAAGTTKSKARPHRDVQRLEEELSDALGAVVSIASDAKGRGKLEIRFSNLDQLDGIVARLRS